MVEKDVTMKYSESDIFGFIEDNDVKFIKLSFCDLYGKRKIISIVPAMLSKALTQGVAIDAAEISGFESSSEILLYPDMDTLTLLPWRPSNGSVARFYCNLRNCSGEPLAADSRKILSEAAEIAAGRGLSIEVAVENEFYLLRQDDAGEPSYIPFDTAGYLDEAPYDKGEDVRRDICLTLEEMGIAPLNSQHIGGPGQNRIDFTPGTLLETADNVNTFRSVAMTMASRSGLWASFSPKPLPGCPGNDFRIRLSVGQKEEKWIDSLIVGLRQHLHEIMAILNPVEEFYERLNMTAHHLEKRQVVGKRGRNELVLCLADGAANPYLAFAAILYAGLTGLNHSLPPEETENNDGNTLPATLREAKACFRDSTLMNHCFPKEVIDTYGGE